VGAGPSGGALNNRIAPAQERGPYLARNCCGVSGGGAGDGDCGFAAFFATLRAAIRASCLAARSFASASTVSAGVPSREVRKSHRWRSWLYDQHRRGAYSGEVPAPQHSPEGMPSCFRARVPEVNYPTSNVSRAGRLRVKAVRSHRAGSLDKASSPAALPGVDMTMAAGC
jgi:hypothetical protein